ncbi:MAG: hypothetical protein ACK52U_01695 [Synechococcaceae cyanobacterium]|jgi:hypothetical protein
MTTTIRAQDLERIVAEVDRLSQQNLSSDDVKQILVELNLSPDLLDQAIEELQRRDAGLQQQRRRRIRVISLLVVAGLIAVAAVHHILDQRAALSRLRAQSQRITSEPDAGEIKVVSLRSRPELVFRVTLAEAPVGRRVPLACDWLAPTGEIVKQNRFETRVITTSIWSSHCRLKFNSSLTPGSWSVRMRQGERVISKQQFDVR